MVDETAESPTDNSNFSLSDNVRSFIQQAYDNKIDLTVKSNRDDIQQQFKDNFPKENIKSIRTLFSQEIPKIASAYGIESDDVKKQPSKKFSKTLEGKTKPKEQKSGVKTVGISNPNILDKDGKPIIVNGQQNYKYQIKSSQISAFSNSMWGFAQLFCEDLEDFTDSESADIGDLTQPYLQSKIGNSDRGQGALMVGGILGITARKAKKARANRKIRKEKEAKEKKNNPKKDDESQK